MEKKDTWEIPLKFSLVYDDIEELNIIKSSDEFLELVYKGAVAALKQALKKNKSECIIFSIQNYNVRIAIKKEHYKTFLNKAIKHYEALEDYVQCSELVNLKSRL